MSNKSKISWTDKTWNPIIGCSKTSPGCQNCYAERMARRLVSMGQENYRGLLADYTTTVGGWNGQTRFVESALEQPLHWKTPRKVFVCSMGDLFHESVPFEWIDRVFATMALCPQHTFQVLTKRAERMEEYLTEYHPNWDEALGWLDDRHNDICIDGTALDSQRDICDEWHTVAKQWPLPNVWLGVTVENQEQADKRIHHLLRCPAAVRFISVEPMLGPVDLMDIVIHEGSGEHHIDSLFMDAFEREEFPDEHTIDWVICGGESGTGARPMHPDWVRSLRDQCIAAGVPFHFKSWGEWAEWDQLPQQISAHQSSPVVWMAGNGICSHTMKTINYQDEVQLYRVGKHLSGRLLDGHEWLQFPEVAK